MQCGCGAETAISSHEVKTMDTAKTWCQGVTSRDLPIPVVRVR